MTETKRVTGCVFIVCILVLGLQACGVGGGGTPPNMPASNTILLNATQTAQLEVAQLLFEEKALSASGQLACSTCHTDETAHSTPDGVGSPLGGVAMSNQGFRSSPSLLYKAKNPAFSFNNNGDPVGGFNWDGRANTLASQADGPLLASTEMANPNSNAVVSKLKALSYFNRFSESFGVTSTSTDQQIYDALLTALQTYQQLDPDYLLFNSKYDRFLDGEVTLSAQELRGLSIFNDNNKGNCASCHTSRVAPNGDRPVFTNFRYAALGLPRNPNIIANADASFFDLGLCGPKRTDLSTRFDLCGSFKVPTLRNIAITAPYFHNSSVDTLSHAVEFYATRDTNPQRWYTAGGLFDKFNDLPPAYRNNVQRGRPFGGNPGDTPILSAQNVSDLVAFLQTLTDDRTAPARSTKVNN